MRAAKAKVWTEASHSDDDLILSGLLLSVARAILIASDSQYRFASPVLRSLLTEGGLSAIIMIGHAMDGGETALRYATRRMRSMTPLMVSEEDRDLLKKLVDAAEKGIRGR